MDDDDAACPMPVGDRVSHSHPDLDDATAKKYRVQENATRIISCLTERESLEAINRAMQRKESDSHDAADSDIDDIGFWNEDASGDWWEMG